MTELLTAGEMRALEQAAIGSGIITGREMMERAGYGVVEAVLAEWPDLAAAPHRALVLCGPGNNGGDGFVVARLLREWGWAVDLRLYGDPDRLPADAKANHDRWCGMGEVGRLAAESLGAPDLAGGCDLIVDAVFGTGLTRPVALPLASLAPAPGTGGRPRCVAIDLPTGICSDSGRRLGPEAGLFPADLTVTFHRMKLGHVLAEGPAACGRTRIVGIGLDRRARRTSDRAGGEGSSSPGGAGPDKPPTARLVEAPDAALLHKGGTAVAGHKFTHGHALVLAGGFGRTGAARLAARAALRIGAGLVTLGAPGAAQMEVAGQITALMLRRVEDGAALTALLGDRRLNALCLGPGMGIDRAATLLPAALQAAQVPATVLDADALTALASEPGLFAMLHPRCVLTPHGGEFARLFPDLADRLSGTPARGPAFSKLDATRAAAARAGCTILLKGADTVIAAPDGRAAVHAAIHDRAAPWLATAGAGDVLAGIITGLLARGFAPMDAACLAAWLHVEAARAFGPGLIAEDLPDALPAVLRDM